MQQILVAEAVPATGKPLQPGIGAQAIQAQQQPAPHFVAVGRLAGGGGDKGTRIRQSWRKLHIAVDADTGQIAAAVLTTSNVDDASQVVALLNQMNGPVTSFTAEGAYD